MRKEKMKIYQAGYTCQACGEVTVDCSSSPLGFLEACEHCEAKGTLKPYFHQRVETVKVIEELELPKK